MSDQSTIRVILVDDHPVVRFGLAAIIGLQPKRAEVILAGACIVRTVMDKLRQDAVRVSDRGLRHGLLVERFGD